MPTNIRIIHAHDFIKATAEGHLDFEESKKLLMEIASASADLVGYEIIVDCRKAEAVMSASQLWFLAAELTKFRKAFSRKMAVICLLERFEYTEYFTQCSRDKGFNIRAFTSLDDAIEWLTANGS